MNDKFQSLFNMDQNTLAFINPLSFILNVFLVCFFCYLLGLVYTKYGKNLSNRSYLAITFPLLGLATMAIITVVKSSLALSLGLVGALSIVRFRTPIKEPEELIYLFICLSIGLSVGANQRLIALLTLASASLISYLLKGSRLFKSSVKNAFTVLIKSNGEFTQNEIIVLLKKYCYFIDLKRFRGDPQKNDEEFCFLVGFKSFNDIEKFNNGLKKLSINAKVDIIDQNNIVGGS